MKPEPADTPADTAGNFEEVQSNRTDGRARQVGSCEDRASEMGEKQERDTMQLQPERVRAEAMTARPVSVDVELELFDPILGRPAVVVPRDEIRGAAPTVRDHEAQIESLGGDVDLDENASGVRSLATSLPSSEFAKLAVVRGRRSGIGNSATAPRSTLPFTDSGRFASGTNSEGNHVLWQLTA